MADEKKSEKVKIVSATLATGTKVTGPEKAVNVAKARAEQSVAAAKSSK